MTSLFGGAGGAATYVNTTSGGLEYVGGSGSETLDASLSKGVGELYGANDPAGHDLLIAGQNAQFLTAGTGSDTLVGGGGENGFFFWSGYDGGRNDVISNFSAIDYVYLGGYGPGGAAAAIAGATTTGGSTTITLSDNTKITFIGVTGSTALNGHIYSA
jgi:Ca2+-binding RTX toxin-like protein